MTMNMAVTKKGQVGHVFHNRKVRSLSKSFVQSQQQKHSKKMWNMIKVFNKNTKTTLMTLITFWCFPVNFTKFLRTPFIAEHLWELLLTFLSVIMTTITIGTYYLPGSKRWCTGSRLQMFPKKATLKNLPNSRENFCARVSFQLKRKFSAHSFIKKEILAQMFSNNFRIICQAGVWQKTSGEPPMDNRPWELSVNKLFVPRPPTDIYMDIYNWSVRFN